MSMFAGLTTDNDIKVSEDSLGGFAKIEETGMYEFVIESAFAGQSSGGAFSVTLKLKAENGAKLTVTEYITSGTAKGCKNYYLDKQGNKQYLPGYNKIRSLDVLLTNNANPYPSTTTGKVMLWDNDLKKEIPQDKEVITAWTGKKIKALVMKVAEDKRVKNDSTGDYEPVAEFRVNYEVQHFLDVDSEQTLNERTAGTNGFKDRWLAKFPSTWVSDKRDKSKHLDLNAPQQSNSGLAKPTATDTVPDDSPF